jgi:hypothetical protein
MISNLDDLKFEGGYPTAQTSQKLYEQLDLQRASQDYLDFMSAISMQALLDMHPRDYGVSETGGHDHRVCHKATYAVPENDAFWSLTVYGSDGYMKSDNNIVSSANVKLNADGTFDVYFGSLESCADVPNRVDTTEGWNVLMRVYRPGQSVLEGAYTLPAATPVR